MGYSLDELRQREEQHKEAVYSQFDKLRNEAYEGVRSCEAYVNSGAYEDQDAFMAYDSRRAAWEKRHDVESMIQKLYSRPYFAHIEIQEKDDDDSEHFYLSDNESLDRVVHIGHDGYLMPFKRDINKPMTSALFHCYQSKGPKEVRYRSKENEIIFFTRLICDDEIHNRKLVNVMQLFPEQDIVPVNADELLEQILQENRSNPMLRNIIATLQQQQFRIIETDVNESFVVQGCAGSGKSQCLFHRLFYLRENLSQDGWEHVLLLTPTQLFRNYSADLIHRYQLSDIEDCSISELYRNILERYDPRFKNRQYRFELSEEYLPDGYLKKVYSNETIQQIDFEIEKAISSYIEAGCKVLGVPMPADFSVADVTRLIEQLEIAIQEFDSREAVLQQDYEYNIHRDKYEKTRKMLDSAQQTLDRLKKEYDQIDYDEVQIRKLSEELKEANEEREEWLKQRRKRIETAGKELARFDFQGENGGVDLPARYMHQLYIVRDLTEGETFISDEKYLQFLDEEYSAQTAKELSEKLGNLSLERYIKRLERRKKGISERIKILTQDVAELTQNIAFHEEWLRSKAADLEGEQSLRTLRRADMERARYFLSRIESSVFEREVWGALAPQKEAFAIQTLSVEELGAGRKRETRILYKSDLLFYVKIYVRLHGTDALPRYTLLCIDEGQDLHQADYDLLRNLFPMAKYNVFGDINQVLHTACGVQNWEDETQIGTVFQLDRNYRNEAEIVEFCNRKFGCDMKYVGKVQERKMSKELHSIHEIQPILNEVNLAIILKDKVSYERLCEAVGTSERFEYLDMNTVAQSEEKIPCYSIFAAKGLEFPRVLVLSNDMTSNQKIVACTRATERLYYYE